MNAPPEWLKDIPYTPFLALTFIITLTICLVILFARRTKPQHTRQRGRRYLVQLTPQELRRYELAQYQQVPYPHRKPLYVQELPLFSQDYQARMSGDGGRFDEVQDDGPSRRRAGKTVRWDDEIQDEVKPYGQSSRYVE
ncbi:MAG: hypothetical protein Q9186_004527 [Xanthomendoza sp. 1 TL-2023]